MERDAQIVIGPDGTVLAATSPLPSDLVGVHLEDCKGLARDVRDAGKALLDQLRRSPNRALIQRIALEDGGGSVRLVAIEALAIRRTATDLRVLLTPKPPRISAQVAAAPVTLSVVVADGVPGGVYCDS